jgi:hypothetical protein
MRLIIIILGILQMLGGVLAFIGSQSAIHQILGAVSFGLGTICIALVMVIMEIEKLAPRKG